MSSIYRRLSPTLQLLLGGTALSRIGDSMSVPFLALYIATRTHTGPATIGIIIGLDYLSNTVGGMFSGILSDRFNRRNIVTTCLFLWAVAFSGFYFAHTLVEFSVLNVCNGFFRAVYDTNSLALIADNTRENDRLAVFGIRYIAINIGTAIGPILGVSLSLVAGPIPLVITAFIYVLFGFAFLTMRLRIPYYKETKDEQRKAPVRTFKGVLRGVTKDNALLSSTAAGVLIMVGYAQLTVTLPQLMAMRFASGAKYFAVLMTLNAVVVIMTQSITLHLFGKKSSVVVMILGCIAFALGSFGFGFSHSLMLLGLSIVLFTFGEVLYFPSANAFVDMLSPPALKGTYFGAQNLRNLGLFVGPWLGGVLLKHFGGETLFVVMSIAFLAAIGLIGLSKSLIQHERYLDGEVMMDNSLP